MSLAIGKFIIMDFSTSVNQKNAIDSKNKGAAYFSTQKEALLDFLTQSFPNYPLEVIAVNTRARLKIETYKGRKLILLPCVFSILFSSILYNILSTIHIFSQANKHPLIFIYSSAEAHPYILALLFSKLLRNPIFMCIRNPPMSLVSFDKFSGLRYLLIKLIDAIYLELSNKIIHISQKSKELLRFNPKLYDKSIVMGSCPTELFLNPSFIWKRSSEKDLRFVYWGVTNKNRDLGIVLKGFAKAKQIDPNFDLEFHLFGDGDDLERLKSLVIDNHICDVKFKGYTDQCEIYDFLEINSIAVIPIPPKEIFQYSSPLKLAEAITLGIPMIATDIEPHQIVRDANIGILCEHNIDSYAAAFLKIWSFSAESHMLEEFRENCNSAKSLFAPENVFQEVIFAIRQEIKKD